MTMSTAQRLCSALEHVVVTVGLHPQLDVGCVGTRDGRLGHRISGRDLAGQQRLEPTLLVLGCAEEGEDFHVAGVRSVRVGGLRGQMDAAAQDFGKRRILDVGEARPPLRVWVEEVPQPTLVGLGLELLEDRRVEVGVPRLDHLLLVDGFGWVHVVVHEGQERVAVLQTACTGRKVHGGTSSGYWWASGYR
jgi:hypothetical protein